jgi:hypothetical protein
MTIRNAAVNVRGPNGWRSTAARSRPCAMSAHERLKPQPGQGNPVIRRNAQADGSPSTVSGVSTVAAVTAAVRNP